MSRVKRWVRDQLEAADEAKMDEVRITVTMPHSLSLRLEALGKRMGMSKSAFAADLLDQAVQEVEEELGLYPFEGADEATLARVKEYWGPMSGSFTRDESGEIVRIPDEPKKGGKKGS